MSNTSTRILKAAGLLACTSMIAIGVSMSPGAVTPAMAVECEDVNGDNTASDGGNRENTACGRESRALNGVGVSDGTSSAYGWRADALASESVAVGSNSQVDERSTHGIAIGRNALVEDNGTNGSDSGIAIGRNSRSRNDDAIAMGGNAESNGNRSIAVGRGANANTDRSVAIGDSAFTGGDNAIAMGRSSNAGGFNSIAVGRGANASATGAIAIGGDAGDGTGAQATGTGSIAIGREAVAIASTAMGDGSFADNDGSAYGENSNASGQNSSAMGLNASATHANSAAWGNNATTTRDNQQVFGNSSNTYTMGGITSGASKAAQGAPTHIVTSNGQGDLAAHSIDELGIATVEGVNRKTSKNAEGVAIAASLADPDLVGSESFGLRMNWGGFDGENALGFTAMGVLSRDFLGTGTRLAFGGGLGVGLDQSEVGGRAGGQITW